MLMQCDSLNIWLRPGREANAAQKNVFIEREGGREALDCDEGRVTEWEREREEVFPQLGMNVGRVSAGHDVISKHNQR